MNILFTGTNPEKYKNLGNIINFPMIKISPALLNQIENQRLIDDLKTCDMILLTSRFTVKYFFEILNNQDEFRLQGKDIIVIGKNTEAALKNYYPETVTVSQIETSQGILQEIIRNFTIEGKKILFPRSSFPNPYLKEELTKLGANVEEFIIYQNTKPNKRELPLDSIDKVLFTSPSTVKYFLMDYTNIPEEWDIICKGPVTRKYLKEAGYESEII